MNFKTGVSRRWDAENDANNCVQRYEYLPVDLIETSTERVNHRYFVLWPVVVWSASLIVSFSPPHAPPSQYRCPLTAVPQFADSTDSTILSLLHAVHNIFSTTTVIQCRNSHLHPYCMQTVQKYCTVRTARFSNMLVQCMVAQFPRDCQPNIIPIRGPELKVSTLVRESDTPGLCSSSQLFLGVAPY